MTPPDGGDADHQDPRASADPAERPDAGDGDAGDGGEAAVEGAGAADTDGSVRADEAIGVERADVTDRGAEHDDGGGPVDGENLGGEAVDGDVDGGATTSVSDRAVADGSAERGPVPTGCPPVDELLGGGFERGTVTQLYGPPAAGKTNLALSAAVDVAAEGGIAVYLDTEGLSVERFRQLLAGRTDDVEAAASRIAVSGVHDFDEQAEAVRDVAELADAAELIVLDSATGFYRLERGDDDGETLRQVASQVTHLLSLARRFDLAVVVTNQVYSDPEVDGTSAKPLGGHTLAHWTGVVLRLERFRGGRRRATLRQHGSRPAGESVEFQITDDGLTGVGRR